VPKAVNRPTPLPPELSPTALREAMPAFLPQGAYSEIARRAGCSRVHARLVYLAILHGVPEFRQASTKTYAAIASYIHELKSGKPRAGAKPRKT
jgi:hypothetical protein